MILRDFKTGAYKRLIFTEAKWNEYKKKKWLLIAVYESQGAAEAALKSLKKGGDLIEERK